MDMKEEYSARYRLGERFQAVARRESRVWYLGKPSPRCSHASTRRSAEADLNSSSWQAVVKQWKRYVDRAASKVITFFGVAWVAAFARRGAIPAAKR